MVASAGVRVSLFLAEKRLDLTAVAGPDLVPQFVEQFEHGERLLGRPQSGDGDGGPLRCHSIGCADGTLGSSAQSGVAAGGGLVGPVMALWRRAGRGGAPRGGG